MSALLVLALVVPFVAAAATRLVAPADARTVVRGSGAVAGACWFAVLVGGEVAAGPFTGGGPVAAAGVGAGIALASISHPARRLPALAGALAAGIAVAGLAAGAGGGSAAESVIGLLVAGAVVALGARAEDDAGLVPAAVGLAGAALAGLALAWLASGTGSFALDLARDDALDVGVPLLAGAVAVAVAAGLRPRRTGAVVLAPALALVVPAGAALAEWGEGVAIVAALGAVAVVAVPRRSPVLLAPGFALWAAAAALVPGDGAVGAAWLLAAAAVIAATTLAPIAALAALPGAAALGGALLAVGRPSGVVLAALGAVTALVVHPTVRARLGGDPPSAEGGRPIMADGPAAPSSQAGRPRRRAPLTARAPAPLDASLRPDAGSRAGGGARRTSPLVAPSRRDVADAAVLGPSEKGAPVDARPAASPGGGSPDPDDRPVAPPARTWSGHRLGTVPALVVAAWLVVAPTTWGWVGPLVLDHWTLSVLAALGAGLVAVVALAPTGPGPSGVPASAALDRALSEAVTHLEGADLPSGSPDGRAGVVAVGLALVATMAAAAALVASWPPGG